MIVYICQQRLVNQYLEPLLTNSRTLDSTLYLNQNIQMLNWMEGSRMARRNLTAVTVHVKLLFVGITASDKA